MFDLQSFLSGLALGLAGKPLALAREPVAYLYNGVRLPKLPEWDRVAYPYAVIAYLFFQYRLVLYTSKPTAYKTELDDPPVAINVKPSECKVFLATSSSASWEEYVPTGELEVYPNWSDFDLAMEDGTVAIQASVPIPVYE